MGLYKTVDDNIIFECESVDEFITKYYKEEFEFLELTFKNEEMYNELYELVKDDDKYQLLHAEFYAYGKVVEENNIKFFEILNSLVAKKDKRAIFYFGIACLNGEGIDQDEKLGIKHLLKASDMGYSLADYELCIYYANHYAISKVSKYKGQIKLRGSARAQFMLAVSLGQANNPSDAFTYMLCSAKKGYVPAFKEVAVMYKNGYGTKKSQKDFDFWSLKAENAGYPITI